MGVEGVGVFITNIINSIKGFVASISPTWKALIVLTIAFVLMSIFMWDYLNSGNK